MHTYRHTTRLRNGRISVNPSARSGVVLLVVISLLVLFSLVGLAFVVYAEGQANVARLWREAETTQLPAMDPELLLSYFLGQLVYDTDNPHSALRGHGLARNMYGRPGGMVPFNGVGRIHTGGADDFYNVDYTRYGGAARDPDQYGSPNPPYTYPDFNHMYLAAQRASTGAILIPSYSRMGPAGPVTLRPNAGYHTAFPPLADPSGDVKNLAEGPGYGAGPNDSIWIDAGFPVMTAPDGRRFKPLFAPLVLDLDNRINANVHGNIRGETNGGGGGGLDPRSGRSLSDQGFGPWEVNPAKVITATDGLDPGTAGPHAEARRLFIGDLNAAWGQTIRGRYDIKQTPMAGPWGEDSHRLPEQYAIRGPSYSPTNGDANYPSMGVNFPGVGGTPATSAFPYYTGNFDGWQQGNAGRNHPMLYNFFMPNNSYYDQRTRGLHFQVSNMEALLRYGDAGSPCLTSHLFLLCPRSFGDPTTGGKTRRLVTTHTFDVDQPGVTPWLWSGPDGTPLRLNAGALAPSGPALPFPPPGAPPSGSEFDAQWKAVTAGCGRINLNRDIPKGSLPWYHSLTGAGAGSFPAALSNGRITTTAAADAALEARKQFCEELFFCARWITGAADPATATPGTPEFDALRWLAQLCVNIVDMIDVDDYATPFQWQTGHWVFGNELPRLVINEVYMEIANDPADPKTSGRATRDYKVNTWVELLNPRINGEPGGAGGAFQTAEGSKARLWVPASGTNPGYAAYRVVIATAPDARLRNADNVRGEPDATTVKTTVADYAPEPTDATTMQPPAPTISTDETYVVHPSEAATSGPVKENRGYYVLGPKADFPGTDAARPQATLRVQDKMIGSKRSSMVYEYDRMRDPAGIERHTILLQRLACAALPPQEDPNQPRYNPYVTVDYVTDVAVNDAVDNDNAGPHAARLPVEQRASVGRNQPYAADRSQQVPQKPMTALTAQPQQTLFKVNVQSLDAATNRGKTNPPTTTGYWPYDWLTFCDRPLVSPMELLVVSAFKPHELTQQFAQGTDPATGRPTQRFGHLAPWFDNNVRIFRLFEFLSATSPMQWVPVGGRTTGRMNINTMFDPEIFSALGDKAPNHFYSQTDIDQFYLKMLASRTVDPSGRPGPGDRPFRGMAMAHSTGDAQYPTGAGIEDTLLRPDPADANPNQAQRRRLFEPQTLNANANGHPYIKYEFLKKVCNNFTTRSNIFAVWLTVGFFEVLDDGVGGGPPRLGAELGRAENRQKRHRMFAIIDRTNVTIAFDPATRSLQPGRHGARPFFLPSHTRVGTPGVTTIDVPGVSGEYEYYPWSIRTGDWLVVDSGQNQEVVQVTAVSAAPPRITANFTKRHAARFSISNAVLGNPGPQPRFEVRHPDYQGVVRFFSIVE